jgi:hypothetical protein
MVASGCRILSYKEAIPMVGIIAALTRCFRRKLGRGQIIRVTTTDSVVEFSVNMDNGKPVTVTTATGKVEQPIIEVVYPEVVKREES